MGQSLKASLGSNLEAVNALQRVLLAGDSPGVKMAAGYALELLLKIGISGRAVPIINNAKISFVVSVTVLSDDMERVLTRKHRRGGLLPRTSMDSHSNDSFLEVAKKLATDMSGDQSTEIVLSGRALSVEIWDDFEDELQIGFNFLAISRDTQRHHQDHPWQFSEFSSLDLNSLDPREALALSEMMTIMGVKNPYDDGCEDTLESPAA